MKRSPKKQSSVKIKANRPLHPQELGSVIAGGFAYEGEQVKHDHGTEN